MEAPLEEGCCLEEASHDAAFNLSGGGWRDLPLSARVFNLISEGLLYRHVMDVGWSRVTVCLSRGTRGKVDAPRPEHQLRPPSRFPAPALPTLRTERVSYQVPPSCRA